MATRKLLVSEIPDNTSLNHVKMLIELRRGKVVSIEPVTKGSITSVQAVYVPLDELTDPGPATTFAQLQASADIR